MSAGKHGGRTADYVRKLCLAALFVALDIIFTRFLSFMVGGYSRLSLQFLPHSMSGWLLGPFWAIGSSVTGDVLGMAIQSGGFVFSPLITLAAALKGAVYGLALYRKPVSLWRIVPAVLAVVIFVDLGLVSYALVPIYKVSWWALVVGRAPVSLISAPIFAYVLYTLQKALVNSRALPRI